MYGVGSGKINFINPFQATATFILATIIFDERESVIVISILTAGKCLIVDRCNKSAVFPVMNGTGNIVGQPDLQYPDEITIHRVLSKSW